jgi:hypothetical protein
MFCFLTPGWYGSKLQSEGFQSPPLALIVKKRVGAGMGAAGLPSPFSPPACDSDELSQFLR